MRQSTRRGELVLQDTSRVNTGMALIEGAFEGIQVGVVRAQILYTAVYPVVVERRGCHHHSQPINQLINLDKEEPYGDPGQRMRHQQEREKSSWMMEGCRVFFAWPAWLSSLSCAFTCQRRTSKGSSSLSDQPASQSNESMKPSIHGNRNCLVEVLDGIALVAVRPSHSHPVLARLCRDIHGRWHMQKTLWARQVVSSPRTG